MAEGQCESPYFLQVMGAQKYIHQIRGILNKRWPTPDCVKYL